MKKSPKTIENIRKESKRAKRTKKDHKGPEKDHKGPKKDKKRTNIKFWSFFGPFLVLFLSFLVLFGTFWSVWVFLILFDYLLQETDQNGPKKYQKVSKKDQKRIIPVLFWSFFCPFLILFWSLLNLFAPFCAKTVEKDQRESKIPKRSNKDQQGQKKVPKKDQKKDQKRPFLILFGPFLSFLVRAWSLLVLFDYF